ncbi:MAG: putative lipoprotein [Candidatus Peregrinibacteria bacterium Greene1014_49]|nr:MAG: putative lipoprotein [Candidatus Peregrinibacteria bacterium Greene1014_49]
MNTCVLNTSGGGGGGGVSSSNTSYYKRPPPPQGCGNAIFEASKGEECDEGRFNDLGTCSYSCKLRYCGDGEVTVVIGEECEPTPSAGPNGERVFEVATCGQICSAPDSAGRGGCKNNYLSLCGADGGAVSSEDYPYFPPSDFVPDGEPFPNGGELSGDFGIPGEIPGQPCGDGWVNAPEECDDANMLDGDGCSAACVVEGNIIPVCGDSIMMESEECDDGNNTDGDGCSAFCIRESPAGSACGNGSLDPDEECDDGQKNSDVTANACRRTCKRSSCGDFVKDRNEQCDQGTANADSIADRCRTDCRLPRCGDGIRDTAEECDGSFGCGPLCTVPSYASQCGNGITEDTEQCDDANDSDRDGCSARCRIERSSAPSVIAQETVLMLDADIVIVNPTEIAVALKFLPESDPCAQVVASGEEGDATSIRAAAARQHIPIIKNIPLAQGIRAENPVGSSVKNPWCVQVNMLRKVQLASSSSVSRSRQSASSSAAPVYIPIYRPIASFIPATQAQAPIGDTGPGAIVLIGAGAAGAVGWLRRRKSKTENCIEQ